MVGILRINYLWVLSVTGTLFCISLNCSTASSVIVNSPDTAVNGSRTASMEERNKAKEDATLPSVSILDKTSYNCTGNSTLCLHKKEGLKRRSSSKRKKVAVKSPPENRNLEGIIPINTDYIPVPVYYRPNGFQDASEGRGWITIPLFILFSIIQFKLVSAIFLALFGPMILFLLIVQGFLFKATLILLGFMMT